MFPAKVLVMGANGYVALWVVKKCLGAGYSVRGTVRSLSKSVFLTHTFSKYGDLFELVVVEDITKDGAFDEAVKGVDAIAHTASPFHYKATNPDDLIVPAVRRTTSILNSALKHGSTVKRLILTSSVVAVRRKTKDIPFLNNIQTTKAEELLGLTQMTPLKDICRRL